MVQRSSTSSAVSSPQRILHAKSGKPVVIVSKSAGGSQGQGHLTLVKTKESDSSSSNNKKGKEGNVIVLDMNADHVVMKSTAEGGQSMAKQQQPSSGTNNVLSDILQATGIVQANSNNGQEIQSGKNKSTSISFEN